MDQRQREYERKVMEGSRVEDDDSSSEKRKDNFRFTGNVQTIPYFETLNLFTSVGRRNGEKILPEILGCFHEDFTKTIISLYFNFIYVVSCGCLITFTSDLFNKYSYLSRL